MTSGTAIPKTSSPDPTQRFLINRAIDLLYETRKRGELTIKSLVKLEIRINDWGERCDIDASRFDWAVAPAKRVRDTYTDLCL